LDRRNEAKQQPFYCCAGFCYSVRDAIALRTTDLNYGLHPVAGDSVKMHVLMDHYNQLQFFIKQQKKNTIYYEEINNYINVNIFCMY